MQACQQMCEVLIEAGIDHVFGIPGGGTSPLFNAIHDHRDKIRFILTRHEQAASIMADVYGRLTGKPGVLLGQGVFIGSSGAFGIMEAFMSSSPRIPARVVSSPSMAPIKGEAASMDRSISSLSSRRSPNTPPMPSLPKKRCRACN
jgi:glyoxylate carboligase